MIQLRKAIFSDLSTLLHWDKQEHVIQSDPSDDWNWETELLRDPGWREQLIAEINARPIGFLQIIDPAAEETHYWGDIGPVKRAIDIWIGDMENLRKGYGTEIMRLALERCFSDPAVKQVLVDPLVSNRDAIRFYQKTGFRFLERRSFNGDECNVYAITRDIWLENYKTA